MNGQAGDAADERVRALESLIRKSEKAMAKLGEGRWQHRMLRENVAAVRVGLSVASGGAVARERWSDEELEQARERLDRLVARVAEVEKRYAVGTSTHTLQRNRLRALRWAREAVEGGEGYVQ